MTLIPETILYFALFLVLYFQVFLILTFFENRKNRSGSTSGSDSDFTYPSVTILVPCYNEEKTVAGTLDSLLSLEYPSEKLQIMAIDDGSTDKTWQILKKYEEEKGVRIFKKENGGKHTALNLGLSHTTTELVGCLDADSFVDKMALQKIVSKFEDGVMAVTPAIVVHAPSNLLQLVQKAEYNMGVFTRKMLATFNGMYVTPGPFSIFRREVFEKIGGYRQGHNTEDMELAMRMQKNNMRIENSHNAYVYTTTPKTVKALHKQRVRWVYGFIKNALDYKSVFFKKEYGDFGIYLPFALLSIPIGVYGFFFLVYQISKVSYNKILEVQAVGLNTNISFDWFFLNTSSIFFVSSILLLITAFILIVGRKMAGFKGIFSRDIIYFIFLYSFLFPFWFVRAMYNVAFSREQSWR